MDRKTSILMSLGISVALIAVGILFLCNHQYTLDHSEGGWLMPYHMMMSGAGMEIIMILFWVAALSAIGLVVSGMILNHRSSNMKGGKESSDRANSHKQHHTSNAFDNSRFEVMKRNLSE